VIRGGSLFFFRITLKYICSDLEGMEAMRRGAPPKAPAHRRGEGVASRAKTARSLAQLIAASWQGHLSPQESGDRHSIMLGSGGASKTANRSELILLNLRPGKPLETVDRKTAVYVSDNTNGFGAPTEVRFWVESGHSWAYR
jgi:hypothetical protein